MSMLLQFPSAARTEERSSGDTSGLRPVSSSSWGPVGEATAAAGQGVSAGQHLSRGLGLLLLTPLKSHYGLVSGLHDLKQPVFPKKQKQASSIKSKINGGRSSYLLRA